MSAKEIVAIDRQIKALAKKKEALLSQKRADALDETREQVALFNFTAEELGIAPSGRAAKASKPAKERKTAKRAKPAPKFCHPGDPSLTWSGGRGQYPTWLKEFIAAKGNSIEMLAPVGKAAPAKRAAAVKAPAKKAPAKKTAKKPAAKKAPPKKPAAKKAPPKKPVSKKRAPAPKAQASKEAEAATA